MERILYVSDLDGTLLRNNATLSQFALKVLNSLIEQGLLFTFATARSNISAAAVTHGLCRNLPGIVFNGVFLAGKTGELEEACILEEYSAGQVLDLLERQGIPALVYALDRGSQRVRWLQGEESPGIRNYIADRQGDGRLQPVDSWHQLGQGEVYYFTIIGKRQEMEQASRELEAVKNIRFSLQQDTYHPEEWWLEICHRDATKATALEKLKKRLGVERVICFGDNRNDLPLFHAADACYAVANAKTEVRAAATGVIGSNQEDGVVRWLLAHGVVPAG